MATVDFAAGSWVKVSGAERVSSAGPPFADAIPFAQALLAAAPDRVLWGTDFPHPNVRWMPDDGALVDLFARFTQNPALRRKVLVDNPTRLAWNDAVLERDQGARDVADENPLTARQRPVKEGT